MSGALHHYSPPYESSRPDYTNNHKTFQKIINPRDVSWQRVITIQIGPVCQGTNGRWIPHNKQGQKGSRKRHLSKLPHCSPLLDPSPCNRTLGLRTPSQHLTETTIPLWSTYLSGAATPIRTPDNLSLTELHISR